MKGRLIKKIVSTLGRKNKKCFLKSFRPDWINNTGKKNNFYVVSFSGAAQFADQLLSICSFYKNVGIPQSWTLYSDGSHTVQQLDILAQIKHLIVKRKIPNQYLPAEATDRFPTLQKIEILVQTVIKGTTIFTDSDILFFPGFERYKKIISTQNWYLVDEAFRYFDSDFLQTADKKAPPLNLGLVIINTRVNWIPVIHYINKKFTQGKLTYWSDQTACHILALNEDFTPLLENDFVVGGSDNFKFKSGFDYNQIALRHFVGPVRHKLWFLDYKKLFSIKG